MDVITGCKHYWTVTSECPKCLREKLTKVEDERDAAIERSTRVPELVSECRSLRERLTDALRERDEARAALKG